jgi:alpha-1,3-glucosyltransferase
MLINYAFRFPQSLPYVVIDMLEKLYLSGFLLLQILFALFSLASVIASRRQDSVPAESTVSQGPGVPARAMSTEFLPLMLTSVYCAVGLFWAFLRLSVAYMSQQY